VEATSERSRRSNDAELEQSLLLARIYDEAEARIELVRLEYRSFIPRNLAAMNRQMQPGSSGDNAGVSRLVSKMNTALSTG